MDPGLERLVDRLLLARSANEPIDDLVPALVPATTVAAYEVDDAVAERIGRPVLGWKIGCTSEHARRVLGADGPLAGRVYDIMADGADLEPDALASEPLLEGEFAFSIGTDLPPVGRERTRGEVIDAIGAVHPAIEIIGGRFAAFGGTPLNAIVADAGGNSLLIRGLANDRFDPDGLPSAAATLTIDGELAGSGLGSDVLGDPIEALRWLINHLSDRGIELGRGQVVTTGTATQISPLPPGSSAVVTIEGLGSVRVSRQDGSGGGG